MKFGCMFLILGVSLTILVSSIAIGAKPRGPIWTDPAKAAKEDPDFAIQGEYTAKNTGIQVAALGDGKFHLSRFAGGLPGAGWDKSAPQVDLVDKAGVQGATQDFARFTGKARPWERRPRRELTSS